MSSKSASHSGIVLAYPGEEHWELWTGDARKGGGLLGHYPTNATAASPSEFKGVTHYALPVTSVFCSPFWAATEDESLIPDIVEMRLEENGTKPEPGGGQHYDYVSLCREGERSLLLPILLANGKPIELPKGDADYFDISPNFLALPRNHLVLWRELGRWVVVTTRQGKPAYFQALNSDQINAEATLELKCLLLQLHSQGVIEELSGIVVWGSELPDESRALLENELEMSMLTESRPLPLLPEDLLGLLPNEVASNREAAARRQKIRHWVSAATLAYLLMLACFAGVYVWKMREKEQIKVVVENLEREVGWIEPTAGRWNALEDAINVERFPVDMFLRVVQEMPKKGIRLLDTDINPDRILVKVEAANRSLANRYLKELERSKELLDYEWKQNALNEDPKTSIVTFEVKGTYRYGSA